MNEINRLEAMLEKEAQDKVAMLDAYRETIEIQMRDEKRVTRELGQNLG